MVKEEGYFGIRLQVKREFKSQQVVQSTRSMEIMDEEKRILEDKKAQALLQSIPRTKLMSMLGLPTANNTNDRSDDRLLVPIDELQRHMDVEEMDPPEQTWAPHYGESGSDYETDDEISIRTSDDGYDDDEEDAS